MKILFFGAAIVLLKLTGFLSGDVALGMMALYIGFELIGEVNDQRRQLKMLRKEIVEGDLE